MSEVNFGSICRRGGKSWIEAAMIMSHVSTLEAPELLMDNRNFTRIAFDEVTLIRQSDINKILGK